MIEVPINNIYAYDLNKTLKLLNSETKFKHRSNKKIPHYLLNGKINSLPRIPGSIGDSANKTEESSSQVPVLLREGIWIGGRPAAWETVWRLRRQHSTASLGILGFSASLLQSKRKIISENQVLSSSTTLLSVGDPHSTHSQKNISHQWLFRKVKKRAW